MTGRGANSSASSHCSSSASQNGSRIQRVYRTPDKNCDGLPVHLILTAPHSIPLLRDGENPEMHKQEDYTGFLANHLAKMCEASSISWSKEEGRRVRADLLDNEGWALPDPSNRDPNFLTVEELESNIWHRVLGNMTDVARSGGVQRRGGEFNSLNGIAESTAPQSSDPQASMPEAIINDVVTNHDCNLVCHFDLHGCMDPEKPPHYYDSDVFLGFGAMEQREADSLGGLFRRIFDQEFWRRNSSWCFDAAWRKGVEPAADENLSKWCKLADPDGLRDWTEEVGKVVKKTIRSELMPSVIAVTSDSDCLVARVVENEAASSISRLEDNTGPVVTGFSVGSGLQVPGKQQLLVVPSPSVMSSSSQEPVSPKSLGISASTRWSYADGVILPLVVQFSFQPGHKESDAPLCTVTLLLDFPLRFIKRFSDVARLHVKKEIERVLLREGFLKRSVKLVEERPLKRLTRSLSLAYVLSHQTQKQEQTIKIVSHFKNRTESVTQICHNNLASPPLLRGPNHASQLCSAAVRKAVAKLWRKSSELHNAFRRP